MYEMVEKMTQKLEVRYESQQAYDFFTQISALRVYCPRNRSHKGEWKDQRTDRSKIRANNLTINPYLPIQIVGTVNRQ